MGRDRVFELDGLPLPHPGSHPADKFDDRHAVRFRGPTEYARWHARRERRSPGESFEALSCAHTAA